MTQTQVLCALLATTGSDHVSSAQGELAGEGCDDTSISLDFTLLQKGESSVEGIHRLAHHIYKCDACKVVFATMLDEQDVAEGSDIHNVQSGPPATDQEIETLGPVVELEMHMGSNTSRAAK